MDEKLTKLCRKSRVQDIDEVKGILTMGVNAIGNVDLQGDVSMSGSFNKTIKESFNKVRWFYNHDSYTCLGCPISAEEKDGYLMVTAQINLKKEIGRDVLSDYLLYAEHGNTLEHSIGVIPVKYDIDGTGENKIRKVHEWKWFEFSTLTSWGANPKTFLQSVKSADGEVDIPQTIAFLEDALKMKYSDERLDMIEKQIAILRDTIEGKIETKTIDEPTDVTQKNEPINSFFAGLSSIYK